MKMVKSLLLGSAAGLVAVVGAQAADLPVKAKPVEYVKICSIYGAGFFYIPGTDSCIKIGGWVRFEADFGPTGGSHSQFWTGGAARNNRIDSTDSRIRARTVLSLDVRTQTEYGTVRAYNRFGFTTSTNDTGTGVLYTERAFVQMAGFTFGKTQSYFDFAGGIFSYGSSYAGSNSQTGANGTIVAAYTATFGNGFTGTIALEDNTARRVGVFDASDSTAPLAVAAYPAQALSGPDAGALAGFGIGDYAAVQIPDVVGSLRVDQAWGSAQIAGAMHQVRGGSYGNNTTGVGALPGTAFISPADAYGFAVDGGIIINLPWAKGDKFYVEAAYGVGATAYVVNAAYQGQYQLWNRFNGRNVAQAWAFDAVFGNLAGATTGLQLTTNWAVSGGLEHYWTPALRSSIYASYTIYDYNATASALICTAPGGPFRTAAGGANAAGVGCDPDFNVFNVGSRTIWNPVPNLDIGVEVMYTRVETKHDANLLAFTYAGGGGRPAGIYAPSTEEIFSGIFRVQRNFWP